MKKIKKITSLLIVALIIGVNAIPAKASYNSESWSLYYMAPSTQKT